ncbi:DUF1707 domain-containing protein [Amycolatopsis sp. NPDC059657]|uniref:DUF1707 SHOCT-like domain-containing protein n=1 Tax=Amycolatopsis sp. NPDC059657 TaxID=3346899 RepID=UPI003671A8FC
MNEVPSPQLRISDPEREAALQALGEHMSVGRIDLDEYGERSAQVTTAKTRGDLAAIFEDLPQPHPRLGEQQPAPSSATAVQPVAQPGQPIAWTDRPLNQRLVAGIIPVLFLAAIVLTVTLGAWWTFFIPMAATGFGKAVWGADWEQDQKRHRDRRHELRHDRHELRDQRRERRRELGH